MNVVGRSLSVTFRESLVNTYLCVYKSYITQTTLLLREQGTSVLLWESRKNDRKHTSLDDRVTIAVDSLLRKSNVPAEVIWVFFYLSLYAGVGGTPRIAQVRWD